MPFKRHAGICGTHALSVVNHLHKALSGIGYNQLNAGGACIYSIFQQFLYGAGRALYYFTGGYLVGNVVG
jgi:hypothetical protein